MPSKLTNFLMIFRCQWQGKKNGTTFGQIGPRVPSGLIFKVSFVIFQQKFVDFRSRALECWFYNFFFLCGQSLADHLFFDHLRSIFYHFSLNQYLTIFYIDGAIHPYEVDCSKPSFLHCGSSALLDDPMRFLRSNEMSSLHASFFLISSPSIRLAETEIRNLDLIHYLERKLTL